MKDDARFYDIADVGRLPSVTTILQVISKPALYAWQAAQGTRKAKIIMAKLLQMAPVLHDSMIAELGDEFFKDGNDQAAEAADYGTQAHAIIELVLKGNADEAARRMKEAPTPTQQAVGAFLKWRDREKFEPIKTEALVYSKGFKYAGTVDAIGNTRNGVTLGDWKTSKAIYPEYSLQTVAYKYAAEEMSGEEIPNIVIYRFGKDGSFEDYTVPRTSHPDLIDRFVDAKRLWEWQREARRLEAA